ncbi:2,3-diketo-L-gulonate-binding periplasmic protein YiaO precursor [Roseivivax jejudonensis]|uniref:2,3-diketo-L-gulonate-binding periplasmic protein YiaO n=1 Tax=Roseivivax jejudonensis TaxID=1529041 RepID=A0A1X6Y508_9RHOB|nr:TRAP transporter substrate-binding protein [Roseivivax jejudonensis]SLN10142.1 2,3-diketo-L-gulonate-binding periplasmic protein YiaO precursor [Roseivivax jejudonensis]
MTKTITTTALAALIAGATALPSAAEEWRGWNIHPEDYPNGVALESFAEMVAERTEGRIEPQVYHNGVLGAQPDAIEQLRNGGLDFANFNMGPMGQIVSATNVLSLPFLFTDLDNMHEVMDGEIGDRFADALAEEGIIALSWFDSGARSFYNTERAINTPADLDGLKFRVMNNDLYVQMVDQLGGNATPMAYSEVYQSLSTGVIDGAENNWPSFDTSNHFEVAGFYSNTNHLILPECICISADTWESVSDEDKEIVREAAVAAAEEQRELWADSSEESRQKVMDAGVQVNDVEDPAAFQEAMQPIYDQFIENNPDLESFINDIRATQS